jgi:multiple sugar transport system permease protein
MTNNYIKQKTNKSFSNFTVNLSMIILLILMVYPLAMAMWSALKSEDIFRDSQWFPTLPLYLSNIAVAFPKVARYMINTILVAGIGTAGMLFLSSISAFTFARMKFLGKNLIYTMVISLMMIPGVLTLVPSYMIYKSIVGLNNYTILILPIIIGGSVFGIFLLRTFFEGIPEDVFEAARIDGAKEFTVYLKICLPLSLPIMGTLAIMQINGVWNDYLWPMITIKSDELFTISAGLLMNYVSAFVSNYPAIFSGYLISSFPLVILFVFANKYYIEGLTSSAMKL